MNRLREIRKQHDETQQDVANFLNLTPKAISFYEKGERDIPNATLQKLADHFHVTTDEILGRETKGGYYVNAETAKIANEMKERPELKTLFDASRKMTPEDIREVNALINAKLQKPEYED